VALVRVGPVRIAISALAPFRPPGWGSVGCRTFVELNLSGALDARHHLGDGASVSGGLCQVRDRMEIAFVTGNSDRIDGPRVLPLPKIASLKDYRSEVFSNTSWRII